MDEKKTERETVIEYFQHPDCSAKPMVRMWFPDAGAGADPHDDIEKQILELASKGFGGVEVAMIGDGVQYANEECQTIGWATENWRKLLKKVLRAAAKVPGGFQVDCTITAHWPPAVNTIDPNDDAAGKELSYSITKLSKKDTENSSFMLNLPKQKVDPPAGIFGRPPAYPGFLFTDTFIAAVLVRISDVVTSVDQNGNTRKLPVFDYRTIVPVTQAVREDPEGGYPAGVPDQKTAEEYGWNYRDICESFGPEPAGALVRNHGKADADGNRARMADWQKAYVIDLSGIRLPEDLPEDAGEEAAVGDWVILSTFYRGTGQSIGGGKVMYNEAFVTSYYNEAGTKAVTDVWDEMLEKDPELLSLLRENHGYIFEDSIESTSLSSYWAAGLEKEAEKTSPHGDILSVIAASRYEGGGFGGPGFTEFFRFSNDDGMVDRILEDYNTLLADRYVTCRIGGIRKWAGERLGRGFRGQTYELPGLEIGRAAILADVPESDNMCKGDGLRYQAGTKNIADKPFLSMEAITGVMQEYVTMDDVLTELGQNYSDGVTRAVLHGSPYAKTFNGYNSEWPGWLEFGPGFVGSSYTYRAPFWNDIQTETGYMQRIQAVLQHSTAKIDFAVLLDREKTFHFASGNRFQDLLDQGYSCNFVSESTIAHPNAHVEERMLCADGPAYKALVLDGVEKLDPASLDRILAFSDAGLPIVCLGSMVSRVYGSRKEEDASVKRKYQELLERKVTVVIEEEKELKGALDHFGIRPYAEYHVPHLETTMYLDRETGSRYYYLYNNPYPENAGMMGNNQASRYKGKDRIIREADLFLSGSGTVFRLDPHTGEILRAADAGKEEDGRVRVHLEDLFGGDALILCLTENTKGFPEDIRQEEKRTADPALSPIDLSNAVWNLVIHSFGPGNDPYDPSVSSVTDVDFGRQDLGRWEEIPATKEELARIGTDDMKYVSGIGEYRTSFTLPDDWDPETCGAYLDITYGKNQAGSVTINGTELACNNVTDRTDLGGYLKKGMNTLVIRISSTLYARMYRENSGYRGKPFGMGSGFLAPPEEGLYYNGLMRAVLVPYRITKA